MTSVVHCNKGKYDIYIGRPSIYGNPFSIGEDGPREEVIKKYREWLDGKPDLRIKMRELKGKILGCWCKPLACHGDIIAEVADSG